jgi:hypothetical protein
MLDLRELPGRADPEKPARKICIPPHCLMTLVSFHDDLVELKRKLTY